MITDILSWPKNNDLEKALYRRERLTGHQCVPLTGTFARLDFRYLEREAREAAQRLNVTLKYSTDYVDMLRTA